jgi:hypothetical protein
VQYLSQPHFYSIGLVEKRQFTVINEDKKLKKSGYKNSGVLFVKNYVLERHASFLDYVQVWADLFFFFYGPPQVSRWRGLGL